MTPSLLVVTVLLLLVGVVMPVASMIADEARRSPYAAGAARRYLAELVRRSELEPWEFIRNGVSAPPWVVFENIGIRNTDKWKADMVAAIALIAPENVSISGCGTSICMTPKV